MSSLRDQQSTSAGRVIRIQTDTHAGAPTDGTTEPDIVTSPLTASQIATQGIMVMVAAPTVGDAAVDNGGDGFEVTIWIRNPVTKQWGAIEPFSTPGREWFSTFDFDGGDLYFQISAASVSTDGGLDVHLVEQ